MARRIGSAIAPVSRQSRRGKGARPPRTTTLKSSRKMRQSRSVISSTFLSRQCLPRMPMLDFSMRELRAALAIR